MTTIPRFETRHASQLKSVTVDVVSEADHVTKTDKVELTTQIIDSLNYTTDIQFQPLTDSLNLYLPQTKTLVSDSIYQFHQLETEGFLLVHILRLKEANAMSLIKSCFLNGCLNSLLYPFTVLCGEGVLVTTFNPDAQSRFIVEIKLYDTQSGTIVYHDYRDHREHYTSFKAIPSKTEQKAIQFQKLTEWLVDRFPIVED